MILFSVITVITKKDRATSHRRKYCQTIGLTVIGIDLTRLSIEVTRLYGVAMNNPYNFYRRGRARKSKAIQCTLSNALKQTGGVRSTPTEE